MNSKMSENLDTTSKLSDRSVEEKTTLTRTVSKQSTETDYQNFAAFLNNNIQKPDKIGNDPSGSIRGKQCEEKTSCDTLNFSMHFQTEDTVGVGPSVGPSVGPVLSAYTTSSPHSVSKESGVSSTIISLQSKKDSSFYLLDSTEDTKTTPLLSEQFSTSYVSGESHGTVDDKAEQSVERFEENERKLHDSPVEFEMIPEEGLCERFTLSTIRDIKGSLAMESVTNDQSTVHTMSPLGSVRESTKIDRDLYIKLYEVFSKRNEQLEAKNMFFQYKMATYFVRRKMFYVLKETTSPEVHSKYDKNLEVLGEILDNGDEERKIMKIELQGLRATRDTQLQLLKTKFEKLQTIEAEFGQGLTFLKTGRQDMPALTEQYIKRQKIQTTTLATMRLKYIIIRNLFNDTMKELGKLERFAPRFTIMDYVQLNQNNKTLLERFERKMSELEKTRKSLQHAAQFLAHAREKYVVVEADVESFRDRLESVELEVRELREHISFLKQERSNVRKQLKQAKFNYGLLTNSKMLLDMEQTRLQIKDMKEEIEKLKNAWKAQNSAVEILRAHREIYNQ